MGLMNMEKEKHCGSYSNPFPTQKYTRVQEYTKRRSFNAKLSAALELEENTDNTIHVCNCYGQLQEYISADLGLSS